MRAVITLCVLSFVSTVVCACDAAEPGIDEDTPIVMLLVDTSGSMERKNVCDCTTPGCEECLPDCETGERNRYTELLEVLTGTFQDFRCERVTRDEEGIGKNTYDFGYYLPYHQPEGRQRDDGLLDRYRTRLRFGLATFDGWDTWVGAKPLVARDEFDFERSAGQSGLWSFNPAREIRGFVADSDEPRGSIRYPNTINTYFMDTGIRNARAKSGALRIAIDPGQAAEVNEAQQQSLLAVRPYGGTPTAAALDDLYYLFTQDRELRAIRKREVPLHLVLVSDGYPDDDYRTFGCDCGLLGPEALGCRPIGSDPEQVATSICPFPLPEEGAYALRCGRADDGRCRKPIAQLHVVEYGPRDSAVANRLASIAEAGGAAGAHRAAGGEELRAELTKILDSIRDGEAPVLDAGE